MSFSIKDRFWCRNVHEKAYRFKGWRTSRNIWKQFLWAFLDHICCLNGKRIKQGLGGIASDPFIDRNISNPLPTHKNQVLLEWHSHTTGLSTGGLATVTPAPWDTCGLLGWQQVGYHPRASQVPPYRQPSVGNRAMPFITDFPVTPSQNPSYLVLELGWL